MSVKITIQDTEVRSLLKNMPSKMERAMRAGMEDATALLMRDLQTYPAQPARSTYVRTGTLRRSWNRSIDGSGLTLRAEVGSNENIAPYNRQVQDEELQTRQHARTGWPTAQGVTSARERTIQGFFESRMREELGG